MLLRVRPSSGQAIALVLNIVATICFFGFFLASGYEVAWLPGWPLWGALWLICNVALAASAYLVARRRTPALLQLFAAALGPAAYMTFFVAKGNLLLAPSLLEYLVAAAFFAGVVCPFTFWPQLLGAVAGIIRAEGAA